ncbi:hypothetical protein SAMN05518863_11111 [Candidatus Pantoea symbiotica]|jgi:hypothetical protein|uniref:YmiA family membrane protein n=1 Tax=Candidatus Pantoea symbiotica TaxID=1884370 RepID=A0A1I4CZN8_9GAMM|nr:hypothetical protein SAMN05518863_11111 [Pantoea symbiotica]SFV03835.1 hypothetical protein SAMN05518864_11111 [Pantoea sp. YR525]
MQSILRSRFSSFLTVERRLVWQMMFTGCAVFWILFVVAIMSIR